MTETSAAYFEQQWSRSADPWDHAGRWYEARKYDLTVAALPHQRYRHLVEPACGPGVLTTRLAGRADQVSASDRYPAAVAATAQRCAALPNVATAVRDVRDGPPQGPYDAVVLSEVLYYFAATTAVEVLRAWRDGCTRGGHLALVHYRERVADHVLDGDSVHHIARDLLGEPSVALTDASFLVDVFTVS